MKTNWRLVLALLLAAGAGLLLRSPRLAERPMHSDEGVNALKFKPLLENGAYRYDPDEFHGPTLPYATLILARLTAARDFANLDERWFRIVPVIFGTGLVLLLSLFADGLGFRGTVWAAFLLAVSPAMVFYSRYYIHEMLFVFFTALALAAGWRYWRSRKIAWAILCGAAIGLMQATKETFIITLAAAGLALALNHFWNRVLDASDPPFRAPRLFFPHLAAGLGLWLVLWLLLFSSFLTNASGPFDSIRTYLPWLHRAAGDSPHIHPWYFYLQRLFFFHQAKGPLWSEALVLGLAFVGAAAAFTRKALGEANPSFVRFLALYTLLLTGAYSLISYKTPWCLLSFWHGMLLLAGVGAAVLVQLARFQWAKLAMAVLLAVGAAQLAAQAVQASGRFSHDPRNPYVYAHTTSGILELSHLVEGLGASHPQRSSMPIQVVAPEGDYWPLPWYLRNFSQAGWYDHMPTNIFAPIVLVSQKIDARLDDHGTHQMPGLFEVRPKTFFELYVETNLWRNFVEKKSPGVGSAN